MNQFITSIRLSKKEGTLEDLVRVRRWCRRNNVSFNQLMNNCITSLASNLDTSYEEMNEVVDLKVNLPLPRYRIWE